MIFSKETQKTIYLNSQTLWYTALHLACEDYHSTDKALLGYRCKTEQSSLQNGCVHDYVSVISKMYKQ